MDNRTQQSCTKEGLQPLLQINAAQNAGAMSYISAHALPAIIPIRHKHGDSKTEGLESNTTLYCQMCDKFLRPRAFHANHQKGHSPFKRKKHNSRAIKQKRCEKGRFGDAFPQRRPEWTWNKTRWSIGGISGFNDRSTNTHNVCKFLPIDDIYKVVSETTLTDKAVGSIKINLHVWSVSNKNIKQFLQQCCLDINQVDELATKLKLVRTRSAHAEVFLSNSDKGCKPHCTPPTSRTHI